MIPFFSGFACTLRVHTIRDFVSLFTIVSESLRRAGKTCSVLFAHFRVFAGCLLVYLLIATLFFFVFRKSTRNFRSAEFYWDVTNPRRNTLILQKGKKSNYHEIFMEEI